MIKKFGESYGELNLNVEEAIDFGEYAKSQVQPYLDAKVAIPITLANYFARNYYRMNEGNDAEKKADFDVRELQSLFKLLKVAIQAPEDDNPLSSNDTKRHTLFAIIDLMVEA